MNEPTITRKEIKSEFKRVLDPLEYVCAFWEAGAISFQRFDRWSDIDMYLVVEDERVEETFKVIEQVLVGPFEFDLKYRLPEPTPHGHSQVFYRLKNASPFLLLDIAVMKKSSEDKFLQFEIHGEPVIHFDKIGVVKNEPVDPTVWQKRLQARVETLKTTFVLYQVFVLKELNRGNDIEAFSYYLACTFRPLVEVLRIKHSPYHYNFHTSYIHYDLPADVVERLRKLIFITDRETLTKCREEAEKWFWEEVKGR